MNCKTMYGKIPKAALTLLTLKSYNISNWIFKEEPKKLSGGKARNETFVETWKGSYTI